MLFQYGFGEVWLQQESIDKKTFLNIFKQRIKDIYLQEWTSNTNETSDFRLFKKIKEGHIFENYLNMNNRLLRSAVTQIRLSSHSFFIVRGRWVRPCIESVDRKCRLCNCIEDEYHCLIECPRFINERKGCLSLCLQKKPSMFDFVYFISCKNETMYHKVGLLCYRVMKAYKKIYLRE